MGVRRVRVTCASTNMKSFISGIADVMQGMIDAFQSLANRIVEIITAIGDFRNHAECERDVCHGGECIHCRTRNAHRDEIVGDTMAGFWHKNCGSLTTRSRGFICQECGRSFTARKT